MTKAELTDVLAGKIGITKSKASDAVNTIFKSITGALKKGDKVTLVGFGTFDVVKRAARTGMNPQTKEKIKIKASKVARFKAGKALKDAVKK